MSESQLTGDWTATKKPGHCSSGSWPGGALPRPPCSPVAPGWGGLPWPAPEPGCRGSGASECIPGALMCPRVFVLTQEPACRPAGQTWSWRTWPLGPGPDSTVPCLPVARPAAPPPPAEVLRCRAWRLGSRAAKGMGPGLGAGGAPFTASRMFLAHRPPLPLQWVPLMAVHLPRSRPLIRLVKLNPAK